MGYICVASYFAVMFGVPIYFEWRRSPAQKGASDE